MRDRVRPLGGPGRGCFFKASSGAVISFYEGSYLSIDTQYSIEGLHVTPGGPRWGCFLKASSGAVISCQYLPYVRPLGYFSRTDPWDPFLRMT